MPAPAAAPAPPAAAPRTASGTAVVAGSKLDRGGRRLVLTLRCPPGAAPCEGRLRLVAARGSRSIGSVRFELAPGRQARRTLRLGSRARTALAASRGRVRVLPGAGAATTIRVR